MIHCCVGIMAYNEEANIGHLLQALLVQKTEKVVIDEIVVVASGCTDGVLFFTRRTWRSACARSTMSHRSAHASAGRSPCRNATRIIVASRCP